MASNGWLTAKKTPTEIETARQVAIEEQRARRGCKPKKQKKNPVKKKKKDFLVDDDDDDDDDEAEWNENEEEDELLLSETPSSDDSHVSTPDSFFPPCERRTSRPPSGVRALQKRFQFKSEEDNRIARKKTKANKKLNTKKPPIELDSSSDEDGSIFARQSRTSKQKPAVELIHSSSEEDDDTYFNTTTAKSIGAKPRALEHNKDHEAQSTKKKHSFLHDDESDIDEAPKKKKKRLVLDHDESDIDEASTKKKPAVSSKYFASKTLESTASLVDTPYAKAKQTKKSIPLTTSKALEDTPCSKPRFAINDSIDICSDEDEAVAIATALEASREDLLMDTPPPKHKTYASDDEDEERAMTAAIKASLQDEAAQEDDDSFVDATEQAASSMLDTANELSQHILQTMAQWSNQAVQGMIVDGTVAAASVADANKQQRSNSSTGHEWISHETLQAILPPNITLAEYQLIGVNWLALLHGMKCGVDGQSTRRANVNGILADEMGLGKTCQTIAFLSWLKHRDNEIGQRSPPHLVVAPASVVTNWMREFKVFAPQLDVIKYHGTQKERELLQEEMHRGGQQFDVIVAPITYFQRETSNDRAFLRKIKFDYMIVDEGHLLKNARGIRYKSMNKFNTLHRLLLTGTPVQNNPQELMALLSFLMPLFSKDDEDNDGGESMIQHFVSQEHNDERAAYTKLKQLFSPFVLRRRKADVLNQILPPKERLVEKVELDPAGRMVYNSILERHVRNKGTSMKEHLFTQLRKAAHHPLLLRTRHASVKEREHLTECFFRYGAFRGEGCTRKRVADEMESWSDFEIHLAAVELLDANEKRRDELDRYILRRDDLFSSAKFVRLRTLLPSLIEKQHRILVFSQWTTCLDLLSCLLEEIDIKYLRMDGSTQVAERQSLIDEFNQDSSISIFLLSTKACGQGINLTSADTCVMHDLDFNPFNDLQAEDRCHRIGQKKDVTIIKMVSKDTVDEDIYDMQQRKAKMNAAIMGNEADWKKSLEREKEIVLRNVVDRFLKSPAASKQKENNTNSEVGETCESI